MMMSVVLAISLMRSPDASGKHDFEVAAESPSKAYQLERLDSGEPEDAHVVRLVSSGREVWRKTLECKLLPHFAVTDGGDSIWIESRRWRGVSHGMAVDSLVKVGPDGREMVVLRWERRHPGVVIFGGPLEPYPTTEQLHVDEKRDRILLRLRDPEDHSNLERWYLIRFSSGAIETVLHPLPNDPDSIFPSIYETLAVTPLANNDLLLARIRQRPDGCKSEQLPRTRSILIDPRSSWPVWTHESFIDGAEETETVLVEADETKGDVITFLNANGELTRRFRVGRGTVKGGDMWRIEELPSEAKARSVDSDAAKRQ